MTDLIVKILIKFSQVSEKDQEIVIEFARRMAESSQETPEPIAAAPQKVEKDAEVAVPVLATSRRQ